MSEKYASDEEISDPGKKMENFEYFWLTKA
jgi:hypothetical protein